MAEDTTPQDDSAENKAENETVSDDPFAEFDGDHPLPPPTNNSGSSGSYGASSGGRGGQFADELHSVKINAKFRTFFVDLKESSNGKFVKVSEKSRGGRKSTIMMDIEDLDEMIDALQQMKSRA